MDEARRELGQLTIALAAELRRRRAFGWRRADRAPSAPTANSQTAKGTRALAPTATSHPVPAPPAQAPGATPATSRDTDLAQRISAVQQGAAGIQSLGELRRAVAGCTACSLCETRTQTVFSDGQGTSRVMFVGEAPGHHEDVGGVPFVGRAGQLLTDIIEKGMKLTRDEVTICNVLKCRPPENRDPSADEKALCTPWLDRQIELCDPLVIIPLGRHAAGHLLQTDAPMGRLRGRVHDRGGRKVIPTYHPAYLLRSPEMKRACWEDIQLAMREIAPPGPA